MKYLVLLGRLFFAFLFLHAAPNHFTAGAIAYAAKAGVPLATIAVPVSGAMAIVGALSVLLGYKAKYGAWLLVLFLIPVTLFMHRFWGLTDPQEIMMQQGNFIKNTSILGGAMLITYFGSGPLSLDNLKKPEEIIDES
jgi:putative oxidoreductase